MSRTHRALAGLLLAGMLALAACAGTSANTNGNGNGNGIVKTPTTPPTATSTPKPRPTSVPTTSVAYCQGLLSLAEANSVMRPPAPATTILFENDTSNNLGACSWTPGQNIAVLAVFFLPFPAGTSLSAAARQQLAKAHAPAGVNFSTTPVSGVGDQALYLAATIPTPAGPNYAADLVVADGGVLLGCAQTGTGSLPAATQSELKQACNVVVSRL